MSRSINSQGIPGKGSIIQHSASQASHRFHQTQPSSITYTFNQIRKCLPFPTTLTRALANGLVTTLVTARPFASVTALSALVKVWDLRSRIKRQLMIANWDL